MTITKGSTWGVHAPFADGTPVARSNRDLHQLINDGHRVVGLLGGDLYRTVGGASAGDRLSRNDPSNLPIHLPVDLIDLRIDDRSAGLFATHLIGHDRMWRHLLAAMNVDFWRSYQLGPRVHPNDGVIDVYVADLPLPDLLKVAPRARTGTHVPHPRITLSRSAVVHLDLARRMRFAADDVDLGWASQVTCTVVADALTVVV